MVTIALAPAATRRSTQATSPRDVPNEIIIKFRETAASAFEKQLGRGRRASEFTISEELDELNARHAVREIKPLFTDFKKNRQRLKALLRKEKSLLTRKEKRILRRLKRAPKDAKVPDLSRIYKIQVGPTHGRSLEEVVEAYKDNHDVEYAHLNYIVSICAEPNDSLYPLQWPLNNTGQKYPPVDHSGTSDCDIDAPEAWDVNTGSSEVVVAVIDSGVDYTHRDIDDNMWVNEAELAGTEDVDDDENGYIDDIYGYDFINTDSDPNDDYGHGTHCSGIIAAEGNNGLDIAGVCWNGGIMALKFINHLGEGSVAAATEAFYYAVENGADVISNSWSVPGVYINECESLQEAIEYANSQGVVMVAAAGNDGWEFPVLPAYYEHVISVAATDSNDQKAWFSNYGNCVDIAAPGVDVLSLLVSGMSVGEVYDDYMTVASGTSMACPHVAGACALILSNCPDIQVDVLEQVLLESIDQISPGTCTSGRLNIYKALAGLSAGVVRLDRDAYSCSAMPVRIYVRDLDLIGEETQEVILTTSGGDSETVTLNETSPLSGVFVGIISTNTYEPNTGDGFVQVSHGETITVMYEDIDDGTGNPVTVEDTAAIDCVAPVISNVQVEIRGITAKITFETDEPTTGQVRCGLECGGSYIIIGEDLTLTTTHSILLLDLASEMDYYFVVDANDAAGNQTTDDNGSICYLFTTSTPFMLCVPSEFPTIQAAIDEAWDGYGDTVLVADGTYTGPGNRDIDFKGKALTVKSESGPENCIIDCQASSSDKHRGFKFHRGEGPDSILNGFTITNGYGPEEQIGYIRSVGGAIYCKESSPRIANCIIRGNESDYNGGGIYADNLSEPFDYSKPMVIDCTISGNHSTFGSALCSCNGPISNCTITCNSGGAALYACRGPIDNCTIAGNSGGGLRGCFGPISNCTISGNSAGSGGGLSHCWGPISNCIISGNSASSEGGGLSHCNYGPISNCLIIGNSTAGSKGGGGLHECNAEIINCTIAGNSAGRGGGIYDTASTTIPWLWPKPPHTTPITNCILWDNEATTGPQIYLNNRGSLDVSYSDVQGGQGDVYIGYQSYLDWRSGNIDADPCFVTGPSGDYYLSQIGAGQTGNSPCIDAGSDLAANLEMGFYTTRTDRVIDNSVIDMGYHYSGDVLPISDIHVDGIVNFVDFAILALQWQQAPGNPSSDIAPDCCNGVVDINDLACLVDNWLWIEEAPDKVTGQNPPHEANDVNPNADISWDQIYNARSYDVYFGTDFNDVNKGTDDTLKENQAEIAYEPGSLDYETTYYWRIDAKNTGGATKGDVWRFTTSDGKAFNPVPLDGATDVDPNVTLGWSAAEYANSHSVYFGTDFTDVNNGTGGTFKGNQKEKTHALGVLELDTTCYWRIDEVTDSDTYKGDIWSFTTRRQTSAYLVNWYKFEEGSGDTVYDSVGTNHGTLYGPPDWVSGEIGNYALDLDGNGDYVRFLTGADAFNSSFSIVAWIHPRVKDCQDVFSEWECGVTRKAIRIRIYSNGRLMFSFFNDDLNTEAGSIPFDLWSHIVCTYDYDSDTSSIYIDGFLNVTGNQGPYEGLIFSSWIGKSWGSEYFDGIVDEVMIFDRALSPGEIEQIYQDGLN